MLEMKIKAGRRSVVPGDLPSILGARRAYREIGDMIDALICQMDMLAGDCEMEDDDPDRCACFDDCGGSLDHVTIANHGPEQDDDCERTYAEWHTLAASRRAAGSIDGKEIVQSFGAIEDDDEDSDTSEEDDPSGQIDEDGVNTSFDMVRYTNGASGAGCSIADPGGCQHDGREPSRTAKGLRYGADQSRGPVNTAQMLKRQDLIERRRDYEIAGMVEMVRRIDTRIAEINQLERLAAAH